jgi:DNA-binding NarL/FixJ family response regulator
MVVDFYSRNFESNILNEVLKYFHGSQVVMITTMENKHLNFYNSLYGIKYFISAEERTENILNDLESVFSNDNKKFDNGAVKGLLTTRECEILQLIATGKTSKEIAEMLCISKNTVDTHRNKMLQKLNIANSASLVHFAYKSGLL